MDLAELALIAVNNIPAMVAYWNANERCVFSNDAYREWFGRSPSEMVNMSMRELLGPLYEKNVCYIRAALRGERQVFERRIQLPGGGSRESIATYIPDAVDGTIRGFWAHVADVTVLREREAALQQTIEERDKALAEVRTLRGLLPICSYCKRIRDEERVWHALEAYLKAHTDAEFSHGICPDCLEHHFGPDALTKLRPR
jgi:PAS domain S-box-containing protein